LSLLAEDTSASPRGVRSARGTEVLRSNPDSINAAYLKQFPEFVEFLSKRSDGKDAKPLETAARPLRHAPEPADVTPLESIEAAYQRIRNELAVELLQQIMNASPGFFERLVVDLLVRMGYGGTRKDAGEAVGKSGDGGIDGIIKEDRLGLDVIYIQAKRWQDSVGRPEIQKFVGALQGQRAKKGIFITTSQYTTDAKTYASMVETKVSYRRRDTGKTDD
jgi:restriction system protein